MHTGSEPPVPLPHLSQRDKDELVVFLGLRQDPVEVSTKRGHHYADILEWASRPDITAYVELHRTLHERRLRDAALAHLDHVMRTTNNETLRCRAAMGILRATDPDRHKLQRRLAQNAESQTARTVAAAGSPGQSHTSHDHTSRPAQHRSAAALPNSAPQPESVPPQPQDSEDPANPGDQEPEQPRPANGDDGPPDPDDPPSAPPPKGDDSDPGHDPGPSADSFSERPDHAPANAPDDDDEVFDEDLDEDPDDDFDEDLDEDLEEDLDDDFDEHLDASESSQHASIQASINLGSTAPGRSDASPDAPEPVPRFTAHD